MLGPLEYFQIWPNDDFFPAHDVGVPGQSGCTGEISGNVALTPTSWGPINYSTLGFVIPMGTTPPPQGVKKVTEKFFLFKNFLPNFA